MLGEFAVTGDAGVFGVFAVTADTGVFAVGAVLAVAERCSRSVAVGAVVAWGADWSEPVRLGAPATATAANPDDSGCWAKACAALDSAVRPSAPGDDHPGGGAGLELHDGFLSIGLLD